MFKFNPPNYHFSQAGKLVGNVVKNLEEDNGNVSHSLEFTVITDPIIPSPEEFNLDKLIKDGVELNPVNSVVLSSEDQLIAKVERQIANENAEPTEN